MTTGISPTVKDTFRSYMTNGNEGVFSAAAKLGYRAVTQYKFKAEEQANEETTQVLNAPEAKKQETTAKKAGRKAADVFLTVIGALAGFATFVVGTVASPFVLIGSSLAKGYEVLKNKSNKQSADSNANEERSPAKFSKFASNTHTKVIKKFHDIKSSLQEFFSKEEFGEEA